MRAAFLIIEDLNSLLIAELFNIFVLQDETVLQTFLCTIILILSLLISFERKRIVIFMDLVRTTCVVRIPI